MSVFTNPATGAEEEAAAYIQATLSLLGDQEPLAVLTELADVMESSVLSHSTDQLNKPEAPGKWSAKQVVLHMADSELVWGWRLRLILGHDKPEITGYDQDLWANRLKYSEEDLDLALKRIRVLRESNLRLIQSLTEAERARTGVHSERGEESIEHMIRLYAGHDLVHRQQLQRILENQ
ncbi:MAG: DinB family protein [Calditrichia bacterium]